MSSFLRFGANSLKRKFELARVHTIRADSLIKLLIEDEFELQIRWVPNLQGNCKYDLHTGRENYFF